MKMIATPIRSAQTSIEVISPSELNTAGRNRQGRGQLIGSTSSARMRANLFDLSSKTRTMRVLVEFLAQYSRWTIP